MIILYLVVFRGLPKSDRQPSSVSYGAAFETISGLYITVGFTPSIKAMILTVLPIIFAAIPTQISRCAFRVSSRSRAIKLSAFVAGFDLIPKKKGSCINSLTISLSLSAFQLIKYQIIQLNEQSYRHGGDNTALAHTLELAEKHKADNR